MREIVFGKARDIRGDKHYTEKVQVMEGVCELIGNQSKRCEFQELLEDLKAARI